MKAHYICESEFPMEIAPGVTMLGNYFFNLFLVRGQKKTALFETGVSGTVDAVILQLEGLGLEPDYIIPSHPHSDHITGLPGLAQRFSKAEILAAQGAFEFVTHPKAGPLLVKEDFFISQGLEKMGIRPGRPALETIPDLNHARVIKERTALDLGGCSLELIPVNGHSPGNLIASMDRVLFSSDSLGFHFPGRGFWPLFFTGIHPYLSALEWIRQADPDIICPAHQGPLKNAEKGIQDAIAATQKMIQQINQTVLTDENLASDMFKQCYKDEFTLYTERNIKNCNQLLIKRARQADPADNPTSITY